MSQGHVVDGDRFEIEDETGERHTVMTSHRPGTRYGAHTEGVGGRTSGTIEWVTTGGHIVGPGPTPDDFTIPELNRMAKRVR